MEKAEIDKLVAAFKATFSKPIEPEEAPPGPLGEAKAVAAETTVAPAKAPEGPCLHKDIHDLIVEFVNSLPTCEGVA